MSVSDSPKKSASYCTAIPLYGGIFLGVLRAGGQSAVVLGFWLGFLVYEFIHWAHHSERMARVFSRFDYYRRRVANHHDHHFRNAKGNYGFTTQLWEAW